MRQWPRMATAPRRAATGALEASKAVSRERSEEFCPGVALVDVALDPDEGREDSFAM